MAIQKSVLLAVLVDALLSGLAQKISGSRQEGVVAQGCEDEGEEGCSSQHSSSSTLLQFDTNAKRQLLVVREEEEGESKALVEEKALVPGQPRIVTLYSNSFHKYFKQWEVCAQKALGAAGYAARVEAVNLTAAMERAGEAENLAALHQQQAQEKHGAEEGAEKLALLQTQVAPASVQYLLPRLLREHVAKGQDIMHFDADAFIMQDPSEAFSGRFPDADLVASADCANALGDCIWYVLPDYLKRHGGRDPLAERGFMMNIGAMLFRGNSRVLGLLDELIAARKAVGETWGDQTLLNEVLEQWNCAWRGSEGEAVPGDEAFVQLLRKPAAWFLQGTCTGGGPAEHTRRAREPLKVVILPWSVVTRQLQTSGVVAFHPGGEPEIKNQGLELAKAACA